MKKLQKPTEFEQEGFNACNFVPNIATLGLVPNAISDATTIHLLAIKLRLGKNKTTNYSNQ